jgi:hypothetical protein
MARVKHTSQKTTPTKTTPKLAAAKKTTPSRAKKATTPGVKKPHRFRPGTVALQQIRKYQKMTDLLLRKLPFSRVVREIAQVTPSSSSSTTTFLLVNNTCRSSRVIYGSKKKRSWLFKRLARSTSPGCTKTPTCTPFMPSG